MFTDFNCVTGHGDILYSGSPVLRNLKLLNPRGEIHSVRKCVDPDHINDTRAEFSFTMHNSQFGIVYKLFIQLY